ncbi:MAG: Ig-like domain-containing protein [Flavipsychrobacter sp.]
MKEQTVRVLFIFLLVAIFYSCANIVPPEGGDKDVTPPKLLSITPKDSLINTRVTEIEMRFDEFLELKDATSEVRVSPVLPFPLDVRLSGKKVKVLIPDSLLNENTTYRIDFGTAIRDLHEGNAYKGSSYIFSTGNYFDSLMLSGKVINANTGTPADGVNVMVYLAKDGDSAVVKKKPLYVTKTSGGGKFLLPGMPEKEMFIYALKDANDNMIFDGDDEEIAFLNTSLMPKDSVATPTILYIFKEKPIDTLKATKEKDKATSTGKRGREKKDNQIISYKVVVDTSDKERRTHDVNEPILITVSTQINSYDDSKVFLSCDSLGIEVEALTNVRIDSTDSTRLNVYTTWKENTLYTLRLQKGFAKDSTLQEAMPSKHSFRTKNDDDYAKLNINMPSKYKGAKYLLQLNKGDDTLYKKPIIDTVVKIKRLNPGTYRVFLIIDENENGEWDTGSLLDRLQPEIVLPHKAEIPLKAGWENTEDFDPFLPIKPVEQSPPMRDTTIRK